MLVSITFIVLHSASSHVFSWPLLSPQWPVSPWIDPWLSPWTSNSSFYIGFLLIISFTALANIRPMTFNCILQFLPVPESSQIQQSKNLSLRPIFPQLSTILSISYRQKTTELISDYILYPLD